MIGPSSGCSLCSDGFTSGMQPHSRSLEYWFRFQHSMSGIRSTDGASVTDVYLSRDPDV